MADSVAGADRIRWLVAQEPAGDSPSSPLSWLGQMCRVAARELPATGTGLSLMGSDGVQGLAAASDQASARVEELQFVLGEGPCQDAYASHRPVLAHDLAGSPAERWPAYAPAAQAKGIQAVFAFPLTVGKICLGVLDVYRSQPGPLPAATVDEAFVFADVALMKVLDEYETLSSGLTGETTVPHDQSAYRLDVHQAAGMVMVQLGVGADEALLRLRAHAFALDRSIMDVAADIVARRLVLTRDTWA